MFAVIALNSLPRMKVGIPDTQNIWDGVGDTITRSPIALFIESKSVSATRDPLLQLAIWASAWHVRVSDLRRWKLFRDKKQEDEDNTDDETPFQPQAQPPPPLKLVSIPLITVVGHDESIYFACDNISLIMLYSPFPLGSTGSLIYSYALLSSLRAINEWIVTEFYNHLMMWFGVEGTELVNLGKL
ncbi:hypothetical protein F4859DRAFT_524628 [Xylaria cf. heliscus]|nr:hypothetical protein F4859DRAFT_524628 [Xylaria cf. heliscus]